MSLLEHAEEIYQWLKGGSQPMPSHEMAAPPQSAMSYGGYTIFFAAGELRINKHGEEFGVGVDLDDLWDDLHQDAADQPATIPTPCEPKEGSGVIGPTSEYKALMADILAAVRKYREATASETLVYKRIEVDKSIDEILSASWLMQDGAREFTEYREDAAEQPVRMPKEGESVRIVYGPDCANAGQTDIMRVSNVRTHKFTVSSSDHSYTRHIGDHGNTWCYRGEKFYFERDVLNETPPAAVCAAEPCDQPTSQSCEPEATTPAYETLKTSVLSAFREYHGPKDDSVLVYHTPVFETLISAMVGVSWLDSPDRPMPGDCSSFRPEAAESPAEPAKRVPQIGDVVSYIGGDAVVFNVAHLPHFSAIRLNSCSQTTVGLHVNGGDWTFKESSAGAPDKRVPVPGDELEYHGGYPGEGGYLWFPVTVKAVGEDGQIFFNFTHGNQREFLTHASLEGVSWRWK